MTQDTLGLGIDIGTSGVRMAVLRMDGTLVETARASMPAPASNQMDARDWWHSVSNCLENLVARLQAKGVDPHTIRHAAIDGTSGTMVLVDENLEPVTPALMYNSAGFSVEAERIAQFADPDSITRGSNSALARMMRLQSWDEGNRGCHLLHQSDWVLATFIGKSAGSDDNNALKLGFDPETRAWPEWLTALGVNTNLLPHIAEPGTAIETISPSMAKQFKLSPQLQFHAGTTDSIAAFLATGACEAGDGVTSLGTTLVIKLMSDTRVDDSSRGIYSHRLRGRWLTGGASNTGGGVLAKFFSNDDIARLSELINPDLPSGLDYYPLPALGERFPVNDVNLAPRLSPRPAEDHLFLQAMFEGIAAIEAQAYAALVQLGAPQPRRIFTAGGGAANPVWTAIRQSKSPSPILAAPETEASVGSARLALGLV